MNPERRSIFSLPAGPRAKWVVFPVWLVGIFIAAGPANLPGKFTDAENNESTSYLPGDAESTKALGATEELQSGELAPAVIVYRRESGLTPADRQKIVQDVKRMTEERFPGVVPDGARAAAGGQEVEQTPRRTARPAAGLRRSDHADSRPARGLRALRRPDLLAGRQGGDRDRLPRRATARETGSSTRSTRGAMSCPIRAGVSR